MAAVLETVQATTADPNSTTTSTITTGLWTVLATAIWTISCTRMAELCTTHSRDGEEEEIHEEVASQEAMVVEAA